MQYKDKLDDATKLAAQRDAVVQKDDTIGAQRHTITAQAARIHDLEARLAVAVHGAAKGPPVGALLSRHVLMIPG